MNDDIQQPQSAPKATKKKSILSPMIALFGVGGTIMIAFVIGLAIAFSFVKFRDPAPVTYAGGYSGGSLGCSLTDPAFEDTTTMLYGNTDDDTGIDKAADEAVRRLGKSSDIKNDIAKIIKTSRTNGVNPAILISFWGAEQSFNSPEKAFGCYIDGKKDLGIEKSAQCAIDSSIKPTIETKANPQKSADYGTPRGDNRWNRLLYHYVMGRIDQPEGNYMYEKLGKHFVSDENSPRIKFLQKLVPEQVVCNSASLSSSTGFAFPDWGFKQEDSRWIKYPYNKPSSCFEEKTIGSSGCGPTSLAMVLKRYGIDTAPPKVADDIKAINGRACSGTSYGAIEAVAKKYGLEASTSYKWTDATTALKNGKVVVTSMKSSSYADEPSRVSGGHIIVLMGIDNQGNILINDPYRNYTKTTEQIILQASKGIFIIIGQKNAV